MKRVRNKPETWLILLWVALIWIVLASSSGAAAYCGGGRSICTTSDNQVSSAQPGTTATQEQDIIIRRKGVLKFPRDLFLLISTAIIYYCQNIKRGCPTTTRTTAAQAAELEAQLIRALL